MKVVRDQNLYRDLIPKDAPLYLQPDWMDLFSQDWNASISFDNQNRPIWGWPHHQKSRFGFKKYGRIPFCPDNGPFFIGKTDGVIFEPGVNRFLSNTVIDDRRNVLKPTVMKGKGWNQQDRFYQYFDLHNYPRDFQAVSRSKRKRMKKNSQLNFIRFNQIDEAGNLFLQASHKMGETDITLASLKEWKRSLDSLFDHYLFGIRDPQGEILSAQWLIAYGDVLYGWLAVRNPGFLHSGAREMLLWYVVQWAREKYKIYDLGGSTIPGVRQFNIEMGAQEVIYSRYTRFRPGWLRKYAP